MCTKASREQFHKVVEIIYRMAMAFAHFLDNITDPCFKGQSFAFDDDETSKGRSFAADPCLRLVPVMIKLGQLLFLIIFETIDRIMVTLTPTLQKVLWIINNKFSVQELNKLVDFKL